MRVRARVRARVRGRVRARRPSTRRRSSVVLHAACALVCLLLAQG